MIRDIAQYLLFYETLLRITGRPVVDFLGAGAEGIRIPASS